ncbi:MAG: transposase [Verrucomicrobiales bacterium]|nr:transposase [Verrucomicrobiales bacterium]
MARGPRIHVPRGWYHVTSRGNGGEVIFGSDEDRRRFLGLVAEVPKRFGAEIHAFVLMDNHYHLLMRCLRADVSETIRWLQTAYAIRYNWAHRRRGHVFQGRFKSLLIRDEGALDRVARYLHLNPVRIAGLGLDKEAQRRARVIGSEDPGAELVARRIRVLREYPWSSWRVYGAMERAPGWLTRDRIGPGCGGGTRRAQLSALMRYTEAPIREGRLENPWEGLVAGAVLGDADDAKALVREAMKGHGERAKERLEKSFRKLPSWKEIVGAAEKILGRSWESMSERHGDWGRDGTMAVATRELGWRLVDAVGAVGDVGYAAAAQGVRRFWRRAEEDVAMKRFTKELSRRVLESQ